MPSGCRVLRKPLQPAVNLAVCVQLLCRWAIDALAHYPEVWHGRAQVGFKDMLFMQLHAEAVLDLSERPCQEIQFRAVAGDFMMLRGKFLLSEPQLEVGLGLLLQTLSVRKISNHVHSSFARLCPKQAIPCIQMQ